MEPFHTLEAIAAPLAVANVDTDTIIRIERLAKYRRDELGPWAFEMLRYRPDGSENPAFPLNQPAFHGARILIAGENFGCGSSREDAVWAIQGIGLRAIIAPSFGDIFFGNCFQNGILAIRLATDIVSRLAGRIAAEPGAARLAVDLEAQTIGTYWGERIAFEVEPLRKRMLIEGLDEIALTLTRAADLDAFEARDRAARPWLYT